MNTQSIILPEGWEIDKEKSTGKEIVLKEKQLSTPPKQKAEEYLTDILSQCTGNVFKDRIAWSIDGQYIFELDIKNSRIWCNYYKVWQVFEREYSLSFQQIQDLQKRVVCKALNCEGFTPTIRFFLFNPSSLGFEASVWCVRL